MEESRAAWIDSLKGIAICGVIMIHSGAEQLPSVLGRLAGIGKNGVQLFFLISAYLSYYSLDKLSKRNGGKLPFGSIKKWWLHKFSRLIPLYYIAIAVYLIVMGGVQYWLGSEGRVTLLNILSHILFVNGAIPHYINSIMGVEWYLADLAVFYLLVPLIYRYVNSMEKAFVCLVAMMFGYSFIGRCIHLDLLVQDLYIYENYIGCFWLVRQIPIFLCGIVLFFLKKTNTLNGIKSKKITSYTMLLLFGIMIAGEMYGKNMLFGVKGDIRFAFWLSGIIISQMVYSSKMINNRIFQALGKNSYAMYLFHLLILYIYEKIIGIVGIVTGISILDWVIKYIAVIGSSYLLSLLLVRYVDRPIQYFMIKAQKDV